jgi:hypothetical protein
MQGTDAPGDGLLKMHAAFFHQRVLDVPLDL